MSDLHGNLLIVVFAYWCLWFVAAGFANLLGRKKK